MEQMKGLGADIDFYTGRMGGDCTSAYYITLKRDFTVKEFVERVLKAWNSSEWGSITVEQREVTLERGLLNLNRTAMVSLDYRNGDIIRESAHFKDYYDRIIEKVSGSGGYSASNYLIIVK